MRPWNRLMAVSIWLSIWSMWLPQMFGAAVASPSAAALVAQAKDQAKDDALHDLIPQWRHVESFGVASEILETHYNQFGFDHPQTLHSLLDLAKVAHFAGAQDLSEELLDLLLHKQAETLEARHPEVAEALLYRGIVARYAGERELAKRNYEKALDILRQASPRARPLRAAVLQAQASWLRGVDLDEAVRQYQRALDLRRECLPQPHFDIADNLTWLGWTLSRAGRHAEAAALLEEAKAMLRQLGMPQHALMGTILNLEADAALIAGDFVASDSLYQQVAEISKRTRYHHFPGFSRRKSPLDGYNHRAVSLLLTGKEREAWTSMEEAKAALGLDFLTLGQWRFLEPESYAEVRTLRLQFLEAERRLAGAARKQDSPTGTSRWDLLLEHFRLQRQIFRMEQSFLAKHRPAVPTLETLQKNLSPRTAYIGWLATRVGADVRSAGGPFFSGHWMYVLRPDGELHWIPLWTTNDVSEYMQRRVPWAHYMELRDRATEWQLLVEPDNDMRESARLLCEWFFDPAWELLRDIETLVVEWSAGLPLESLIGPDGRYLDEHFAISYMPSAAAFVLLAERDAKDTSADHDRFESVLSVGNPVFNEDNLHHRGENSFVDVALLRDAYAQRPEALDQLPQLPLSGYEARRVAKMFAKSTLLTGAKASERQLKSMAQQKRLEEFDVIHLASHTLIGEIPERCAVALSRLDLERYPLDDGLIDAGEILLEWELDTKILTLSGCQTARSSGYSRGEFVGFNQALFGAGARAIVSSMWKVDDTATALLMERFYQNLTGNYDDTRLGRTHEALSKAAALREAKLWLRSSAGDDGIKRFEHPIYWSGFILTGTPD